MREARRHVLWLAYFDAGLSRREGRRVPKELAVNSPSLSELEAATSSMNLDFEADAEATHPRSGLRGRLLVEKRWRKLMLLKEIGLALTKARA